MGEREDRLIARYGRLKSARLPWDSHFESLARVMHVRRQGFITQETAGDRRTDEIYDSTPMQARRALASAIDGLLKPKTSRWVATRVDDDEVDNLDETKDWLRQADDLMLAAIYNPAARFQQSSGEVDDDLATFGTGVLHTTKHPKLNRLRFVSRHLARSYIMVDHDGAAIGLFSSERMAARDAEQFFRDRGAKAGEVAEKLLADKKPDEKVEYVHIVIARTNRDVSRIGPAHMPFASLWIEVTKKELVLESGFEEFPFAIPRWDTASGETYGRSPGMIALPDANTLQAMGKTLLKAGQHAVIPPLFAPSDSMTSAKLISGRINFYDLEAASQSRISAPIFPLNTGANMPLGREMQNDTRDLVWAAFFRSVLNLPTGGPEMTATEIIERKEEFVRTIGPVFGRLESDYLAPVVERVFAVMLREGALPEIPEALQGRNVRFEFRSPVEKIRKQIDALNAQRTIEQAAFAAESTGDPGVLDWIDTDKYIEMVDEANGSDIIRGKREVEERRRARAEQQQAEAQGDDLERLVGASTDVLKAVPDLAGAA